MIVYYGMYLGQKYTLPKMNQANVIKTYLMLIFGIVNVVIIIIHNYYNNINMS